MALRDYIQPTISPAESEQITNQIAPSGEFGRGMASHALESQAGDLLSQALDAELNQDNQTASALRAKAAHTMSLAPRMQTRDEGFGGYAAGVLGQLAPELPKFAAAGLAGRGLGALAGFAKAGELAGAALPGYGLGRRGALLEQSMDPGQMAAPAEERAASAQRQGLLGAVAGAVPISHALSSAMKPGLRGLFEGAGTTAAEQALVNTGLTAYGQHEASGLNPNRDTAHDIDALREAAIAGGVGGAGMHGAFAVPGLPLRLGAEAANAARSGIAASREAAVRAGPLLDSATQSVGEAASKGVGVAKDTVDALKERFGPIAEEAIAKGTDFARRGVAAANDTLGRVPEAIRSAGNPEDFLTKVFPRIRKTPGTPREQIDASFPADINDTLGPAPPSSTESLAGLAGRNVGEILQKLKAQSQKAPTALREYYQKAATALESSANPLDPEGQRQIVAQLQQRANKFGEKLNEFTSSFKKAANPEEKQSFFRSPATSALEKVVFDNLKPEVKNDPAVMDKLPDFVNGLSMMAAKGKDAPDSAGIAYQRLKGMFADSDKFEKEMGEALKADPSTFSRLKGITSAEQDASQHDSYLYANLPDQQKDHLKTGQLRQVGALIDRLKGSRDADEIQAGIQKLAPVFGDGAKAQRVVDYYADAFRSATGSRAIDRVPGPTLKKPPQIHSNEDLSHFGLEGENEYIFKNAEAARPFFAGEDNSNHVKAAEAENLKVNHLNYLDYAHMHGSETEHEAARLIKDARDRLADIVAKGKAAEPGSARRTELQQRYSRLKPQVELMEKVAQADKPTYVKGHGTVGPGHEGVLELHSVLQTEPAAKDSRIAASQKELSAYRPRGNASEDIKGTLINAHLKNPVTGTVKPRTFSVEAMAKHEIDQNPSEYDAEHFSTHDARMQAAASRGLAKIMTRPDFVKFDKSSRGNELDKLVVDRKAGTTMSLKDLVKKPATQWDQAQIDQLLKSKDQLPKTVEKYRGMDRTTRKEFQLRLEQHRDQLLSEGEGVGPAAAFAKRRASFADEALKKMQGVRQNEQRAEAEQKLKSELKLTDRKEPDVLENEATDLRAAEAESLKKMRSLTEGMKSTQGVQPKDMREFIPKNKRDEFEFHNARYYAARKLAAEKERAFDEAQREALGRENEGEKELSAAQREDAAARKFRDDFELYGRTSDTEGAKPKGKGLEGRASYVREGTERDDTPLLDRPAYKGQEDLSPKARALITKADRDRRIKTKVDTGDLGPKGKPLEAPKNASVAEKAAFRENQQTKFNFEEPTVEGVMKDLDKLSQTSTKPEERETAEEALTWLRARAKEERGRAENPSIAKDGDSDKKSNYYTKGAGPEEQLTPEFKKAIQDELTRTVGPHVEARFEEAMGGAAGSYTPKSEKQKALIKIAINSQSDMSGAVFHESMHHLFKIMGDNASSPQARAAYRDLKQVAQQPAIQKQLREILKDHPKALDQLHDVDESIAYMYQFWRQNVLKMPKLGIEWMQKVRDFIYNVLGIVSKTDKVEKIMSAFKDGNFSDESMLDPALRDLKGRTLRDRVDEIAPGVGKAFDALMLGATDRLRSYGYNSLDKIADLFHKEPDREGGKLGFLQQRAMVNGMELNRFQDAVGSASHVDMATALRNLQSMKPASTPLEKTVRSQLDRLFKYMDRAGVEMQNEKGEWESVRNHYAKNYFPRVWDRQRVDAHRGELRDLFQTEGGMSRSQAEGVIDRITAGDGLIDLAENEHHLGYTPANQALTTRALKFITAKNAGKFAKFQSQDMNEIMSKYIYQATHRGEYARIFGNRGEVIESALAQAQREGMSPADLASAKKATMALEGTLGHDFNPQLRKLFTGLTAYENVVLLPFALLSSLSDAAGVTLRSGEFKDQFRALKKGVDGIVGQLTRRDESGNELLKRAKEFGIVDSLNMLENYGNIYNSSFMSPTLRRINDKFFRWNGMEMWNRQMRLAGFESAQRFVLQNKGNRRYMDELGLKQADLEHINASKDGGIDFESLPPATKARIQGAMYRFVDGAVLRPNAAQRPVWASDPRFMLIAHLKQFAFSFQNTFLKRYAHEVGHAQNGKEVMRPVMAFLSFLPFGIFSGAVRRALAGQGAFAGMTTASIINDGMMRSGMYGNGMFLEDAIGDVQRGRLPGTSFLGPTAEHAQKVLETLSGGPETPHQLLLRSTPLSPLVKDFTPAPD